MGCRPFCFISKNALSFIYCTEQNPKEIIWLKRYYLLIKHEEAFLNGVAVQRIKGNQAQPITGLPQNHLLKFLYSVLINATLTVKQKTKQPLHRC